MTSASLVRLRRAFVLLFLPPLLLSVGIVVADPPNSESGPNMGNRRMYWVARRDESQPDQRNNIALAVRIETTGNRTVAKVWQYSSVANDEYVPRGPVLTYPCTVDIGTADKIKLEKITLMGGNGRPVAWIVRWHGGKGASAHKDRRHARIVFRYSEANFPRNDIQGKSVEPRKPTDEPCEEVPDDDILEEESLPPSDPNMSETSPPDISYAP